MTVYGYGDDNLVIEGAPYPADEIGCYDSDVYIRFSDGTLIKAWYVKDNKAMEVYINDDKRITLEGIKKMYSNIGASCNQSEKKA